MKHIFPGLRSFATDQSTQGLIAVTASLIGGGTVFYRLVEKFSWLDSLYFTVITLTTVGYGDLSPQTAAGKVFTMVYVFVGIGVLVLFISELASHVIAARTRPSDT